MANTTEPIIQPQREKQHDVLGPGNVLLRRQQHWGQVAGLSGVLAAQERKIKRHHRNMAHLMLGRFAALRIGVPPRMPQMADHHV